jgi:CheY-like chemotaxis protein
MVIAPEKRVLVVDDEPDDRNFLEASIRDAGFQVESAMDGVDAIEKIAGNTPDLITLEIVMPRKSGINLLRKLHKNEKWAAIPVLVITAHLHDEFGKDDIKEFNSFKNSTRPEHILEKPVAPKRLVKAICEILDVEPVKKKSFEN